MGLGIAALVAKQSKGMGITGLVLATVATLFSLVVTIGVFAMSGDSDAADAKPSKQASAEGSKPEQEKDKGEPEDSPEPSAPPKERLTLDEGWTTEPSEFGSSIVVNGYVSNNSDEAVTNYVQITFDTLDAAGANVGTCLANTNTIDAKGKWKFEAHCFDDSDDIAEVRFKEISGF